MLYKLTFAYLLSWDPVRALGEAMHMFHMKQPTKGPTCGKAMSELV